MPSESRTRRYIHVDSSNETPSSTEVRLSAVAPPENETGRRISTLSALGEALFHGRNFVTDNRVGELPDQDPYPGGRIDVLANQFFQLVPRLVLIEASAGGRTRR
jgi:hypothetical protein